MDHIDIQPVFGTGAAIIVCQSLSGLQRLSLVTLPKLRNDVSSQCNITILLQCDHIDLRSPLEPVKAPVSTWERGGKKECRSRQKVKK